MVEKQIELIKKQIDKLGEKDFNLDAWKSSTIVLLSRIFDNIYPGIKAIEKIEFHGGGWGTSEVSHFWDNTESCKKQGIDILEACITELKEFGQPEKKENNKSGININLTQNQTVSINILMSALEDELTVSQLREINEVIKIDEPKSEKRRRMIDKIKSFGSDVASNILANILTNPNIWG